MQSATGRSAFSLAFGRTLHQVLFAIPLRHPSTMKINRQFQDLHTPDGGTVDWVLKQQVDRDICLLYQQLADYACIMGDLYWGSVFALPYWEYLDWRALEDRDRTFIREGCLVMLLTAAWDQIDGSGNFINRHIPACRAAIARVEADTPESENLLRAVRLALDAAEAGSDSGEELDELSTWVHVHYVRGYFERIAAEFRTNPYFGGPAAG